MLDTTTDLAEAAADLIAAGTDPADIEKEVPGGLRALALSHYEARRESNQERELADAFDRARAAIDANDDDVFLGPLAELAYTERVAPLTATSLLPGAPQLDAPAWLETLRSIGAL